MRKYNDKSCDPLEEGGYTGEEIPYIDQKTIECNLTRFTDWLNRLVDQINYLSCLYLELRDVVIENRQRIECLEERVTTIEGQIAEITERITALETRVGLIETRLGTIGTSIDNLINNYSTLNTNVTKLYNWLPASVSVIETRGWKFGMGNINVMSATGPSLTGPGIFTNDAIENNDIYFE